MKKRLFLQGALLAAVTIGTTALAHADEVTQTNDYKETPAAQTTPTGKAPQAPQAAPFVQTRDALRAQQPTVIIGSSEGRTARERTTNTPTKDFKGGVHYGDRDRDVTIVVGGGYPVYGGYGYPNTYPTYPGYGYGYGTPYLGQNVQGASVSISSPGYSNGTFTMFPFSSSVSTYSSTPVYGQNYGPVYGPGYCAPSYPAYGNNYPMYVPGPAINGYRGAATPNTYQYNTGSFIGGGYVPGSINVGRSTTIVTGSRR